MTAEEFKVSGLKISSRPDRAALNMLHRLYLESRHYLDTGAGKQYLESMLKDAKSFLEDTYTGFPD